MTATVRAPRITEAAIEKSCTDFLVLDGWRPLKMERNWSEKKRKAVGELGMADHLYIRYADYADRTLTWASQAQLMWIEFKRAKGGSGKNGGLFTKAEKAKIHQKAWIATERARGALVLLAGEDFPPTIEGFKAWYMASGLNRRMAA